LRGALWAVFLIIVGGLVMSDEVRIVLWYLAIVMALSIAALTGDD